MHAAVSGQYFLEEGLAEFDSTVFQTFQISQKKGILMGHSFILYSFVFFFPLSFTGYFVGYGSDVDHWCLCVKMLKMRW